MPYFGAVVRLALAIIVLMLIGYILPGFSHLTFGEATLIALVIGAVGYGIQIFSRKMPSYRRGLIGFFVAGIVTWLAQFVVPQLHVSLLAALLAAVVIGVFNYAIPNAVA